MQTGKPLTYSTVNSGGNENKRCSPLVFSSFFNHKYFLDSYGHLIQSGSELGMITNQENLLLSDFSRNLDGGILKTEGKEIQQYSIFETNGKFSIPIFALQEVFEDLPESGKFYCYFINSVQQEGFHKQAILRTKDNIYFLDGNNPNVMILEVDELFQSQLIKRITNVSVLMYIQTRQFVGGLEGYDLNLFNHLI